MRKYMRKVASTIGVGLLVLAVMGGLFALSPITAEAVEPESPGGEWEAGVIPPGEAYNDGTDVLEFYWHCWGWTGTGDYYTFSIHESGDLETPIYIQRSDVSGQVFEGITEPLQDIYGWATGTDIYNPEETNGGGQTHDWTVPDTMLPGDYWGVVSIYVQEQIEPEAQNIISFDILQATGELVVFKYNDLNGSGDWESGELGVEGFVFDITGPEDYLDQVTSIDGLITLSDIPIGTYIITEEPLPDGWEKTEPTAGYSQQAEVTTGGSVQVDFGNQQVGDLEIIKEDDTGAGLSGWSFDVTGPVNRSGDTGGGGVLLFEDIPVGDYTVEETMEPGWTNVVPDTGPPYTMDATVSFNAKTTVTFVNEETIGDLEIIKKDELGAGLSGWHFEVTGPVNRSGDTGAGGVLLFEDIPVGSYTVTETMKGGWTSIDPGGSDPYEKGAEVLLNTKTTVEFQNQRPPSVPTLGQWGMIIMGVLFAALVIGLPIWRRRLAANR
jgi:hypothetical protein